MSVMSPLAVAEPWDRVADGYAEELDSVMLPFSRRAIELARLCASARVLDVAAGPGALALTTTPEVAQVTAVDFSAGMLERLSARASALGLRNVQAIQADGQALPLHDAEFDAAFSMFGWMFFPDRAKGLAEFRRVLAPGGAAIVSSWGPLASSPLMAAMFGALHAADPSFVVPQPDPNGLENPERLEQELRAAGLSDVAVHAHSIEVAFQSVPELWSRIVRSSAPCLMLRQRLGEEAWAQQSQLAQAYLVRELGSKGRTLSTSAWIAVGINRPG